MFCFVFSIDDGKDVLLVVHLIGYNLRAKIQMHEQHWTI